MRLCASIFHAFRHRIRLTVVSQGTRCQCKQMGVVGDTQVINLAASRFLDGDDFAWVFLIPMTRASLTNLPSKSRDPLPVVSDVRQIQLQLIAKPSADCPKVTLKVVVPREPEPPTIVLGIVVPISRKVAV